MGEWPIFAHFQMAYFTHGSVASAIEDGAAIDVEDHPELEILLPEGIEDVSIRWDTREHFIELLLAILRSTQRRQKSVTEEKVAASLAHWSRRSRVAKAA